MAQDHRIAALMKKRKEEILRNKEQSLEQPTEQPTVQYVKDPHTTIFTGQTCCGKTHLILDLIEKEHNKHFDYIIIICPTLRWNKTYHAKSWIKNDEKVWLVDWVETLSQLLARSETLFIIDDIIADEGLDKRKQCLLEFAISGRL